MNFDLKTWKQKVESRLQGWKQTMQENSIYSVYGFLTTWTIWPVVQAYAAGDLAAIVTLGNVLSGVGGGLLASRINAWKEKPTRASWPARCRKKQPAIRNCVTNWMRFCRN